VSYKNPPADHHYSDNPNRVLCSLQIMAVVSTCHFTSLSSNVFLIFCILIILCAFRFVGAWLYFFVDLPSSILTLNCPHRLNLPQYFTFMWPCIVTNLFLIKPTRLTNFTNFILSKTLHVSGISFAHHQEFSTLYSTLVYFLHVWWPYPSSVRMELEQFHPDTAWKLW
jgi:hypothetical protein